jgi:hypothetical protein
MNIIKRSDLKKVILAATLGTIAGSEAWAYDLTLGTDMPPITFHGFASQGFLYSSQYNYLDTDTKDGSFRFTEAGINASINPFPRTHITAQGFMFDVGDAGKYQPFLDYASIDYTFADYFGLRGGRIRKPSGIYNHIQDVDLARTYVILPQGIYDARFRDISSTLDGGEAFGDISLSKAGSLSYEVYSGLMNVSDSSGLYGVLDNSLHPGGVTSFGKFWESGYQLWWNAPLDGFRVGASTCFADDFNYNFTTPTFAPPPFPKQLEFAETGTILIQQYSAEYIWKKWTFQAEFYQLQISGDSVSRFAKAHSFNSDYAWYGDASYRFNKWFEAGTYYTEFHVGGEHSAVSSDNYQKDWAVSLRFDPKPWWIIKLEGHYIHGTALLYDNGANPVRNDDGWFMLAVKTTFSF